MRKRIQFMYGGELQTIGSSIPGQVWNPFSTDCPAKVCVNRKGLADRSQVFGTGIQMWVRVREITLKIIKT